MSRARPTRGTDSITLAKPNLTAVHIQRRKPAPLRDAGLQPIGATTTSAHGKPLVSPVPSQAELLARRKSERLEPATDCTPVRNSTMRGPAYTCPELRTNPHRPGSADAFRLPSRSSFAKKG
jgi:hypothetical protein